MPPCLERDAIRNLVHSCVVPHDAVLVVHSAIRELSRQGYRAEAMIEAMLETLDAGTLLMPTMTWRTVTPTNPVWDELATPSHTGAMTEVFRTRYASARSLHPTHSVAGVGPDAQTLLSTHQMGNTPVPATSPYGRMRDYPAFILLIGVGLESCTAIHHPEEVLAPDLYVKPIEEAETYSLRDRRGVTIPYTLRPHRRVPRDFGKYGPLLAAQGKLHRGDWSGVPWMLMKAGDLLREVFTRLTAEPDFNLARTSPPSHTVPSR